MASLYRLATGALLDVTPRKVVSASFSHSAVLSSAALSTRPFGSPNAPEIFDIFDAPVKLRERNASDKSSKVLNSPSTARTSSRAGPSHSKSIYSNPLGLPWSLPAPVTFDGPARPPHMSPSTLKRRRRQRQSSTYSPRGIHGPSSVLYSAFTSQSKPLYQLFDGPSRITGYQYPTSHNERYSFKYVSLALCLFSAFGWLALNDSLDFLQHNNHSFQQDISECV